MNAPSPLSTIAETPRYPRVIPSIPEADGVGWIAVPSVTSTSTVAKWTLRNEEWVQVLFAIHQGEPPVTDIKELDDDCACGGGAISGHATGCPEAARFASPPSPAPAESGAVARRPATESEAWLLGYIADLRRNPNRFASEIVELEAIAFWLSHPSPAPSASGGEGDAGKKVADRCHPSHVTRISMDASSYDEICVKCGATDHIGGWGKLAKPCPCASLPTQESEDGR